MSTDSPTGKPVPVGGRTGSRDFWLKMLAELPPLIFSKPIGEAASLTPDSKTAVMELKLDAAQTRRLRQFADRLGVPLESVLLAVHLKTLSMQAPGRQAVTGVSVTNKAGNNALPLAFEADWADASWSDLARRVAALEDSVRQHGDLPSSEIEALGGRSPLFDTRFHFASMPSGEAALNDDSSLENRIHALWQSLLPGAIIGMEDGFFDAGGNSLLLVRLQEKLSSCWPDVFTVAQLFAVNTIASQAKYVREKLGCQKKEVLHPQREGAPVPATNKEGKVPRKIAIVGVGLRLTDAQSLEECWRDVSKGADLVRPLNETRSSELRAMLSQLGVRAPERFREGAWLADVFAFDPERFRLSPADAALIDPEQRLFLETAVMALEDAGYGGKALDDEKVGVFVGASNSTTWRDFAERVAPGRAEQVFVLNVPSNVATRLPFLHNWRGPANLVDTACSSALAAIHLACQSLMYGECSAALVGAAKRILLPPSAGKQFTIESSTDRTHAFDESADGTGAGEGSVVFFLKTLERAQADGDSIHAVILGTAINQDGASSGMAAPNPAAQAEVIVTAARNAGVPLASLSYIEAHGTGTHLGDPVEIEGLSRAFSDETKETGFAAIGSGKGNYGHLDFCAGGLSLLRALLCLKHDQAPPQPFFRRANPRIDFVNSPVRVSDRLAALTDRGTPRRAGVSSFGLSGINVHAVIEAPPVPVARPQTPPSGWFVLGVSAATKELLVSYVAALVARLRAQPEITLIDLAYTLNTGRDSLSERLVVWVRNREELLSSWDSFTSGRIAAKSLTGTLPRRQKTQASATISTLAGDERAATAAALAYVEGARLAWSPQQAAGRVHLPPAPLQRIICRPELRATEAPLEIRSQLLGPAVDTPEGIRRTLDLHSASFWPVAEHCLNGIPTLVGVGFLPLFAEAWASASGGQFTPFSIRNLNWLRPLQTPWLRHGSISLLITSSDSDDRRISMGGRGLDGAWKLFSEAVLTAVASNQAPKLDPLQLERELGELSPAPAFVVDKDAFVAVSERWDCLRALANKENSVLALLELPQGAVDASFLQGLHPGLLDRAVSIVLDQPGLVPAGCAEISVYSQLPAKVLAFAVRRNSWSGGIEADVSLCHPESGKVCIAFRGFRFVTPGQRRNTDSGTSKVMIQPSLPVWMPAPLDQSASLKSSPLIIGEGALFDRIVDHFKSTSQMLVSTGSFAPSSEALASIADGRVSQLLLVPSSGEDLGSRVSQVLRNILQVLQQPLQLLAVGQGAYANDVNPGPPSAPPEAALMAGLVLVAAQEKSLLSTRYLEVDDQTPVTSILQELSAFAHPSKAPNLIDRFGKRLKRTFVPVPTVSDNAQTVHWTDSGCCVVTGGTGGLALLLAEELAAGGAVSLALISRHASPTGDDADAQLRSKRLESLRERGLRIRHWCADVSDRAQLSRVLEEIRRELGPITAILHNAGSADGGLLIKEDAASFTRATAAKVAGARNLDFLTRTDPIKAFVVSGSMNTVEGRAGAGAYVAANTYLDAFASWRRSEGRPALAIDWCQIGEIGMAARLMAGKFSEYSLSPDDVVRHWRLALASGATQVTLLYAESARDKIVVSPVPAAPQKPIGTALAAIWASVLGYEKVETEDDFYALGGDSMSGMEIVERIANELGHRLALSDILETGTIAKLAARMEEYIAPAPVSAPSPLIAPGGAALEQALAGVWAGVLGYDKVEFEDDFYALGGDSMSGLAIVERIGSDLGHATSLSDILESGNIRKLAERLRGQAASSKATLPTQTSPYLSPAPTLGRYPLGWEQLTVIRAQLAAVDNIALNLPYGISLPSNCDVARLEKALGQLIGRHEILRTRFHLEGKEPEMEVLPAFTPQLPRIRQSGQNSQDSGKNWVRPFDLEAGTPFRFALVEGPDGGPLAFLFDIHHSLADGLSIELLTGELIALYEGKILPPPTLQFKDYAWWSRKGAGADALEKARTYWLERYSGPLPVLDLPADRSRPATNTGECAVVDFALPLETTEALRRFASARRTTPFTVVLATWATLLSRYTQNDDLVISVPVNARDVVGVPTMPGMMVSLLPLRFSFREDEQVGSFIRRVQDDFAEAMRHRACPLGMLLEALALPASPDRSPLSEIRLSYMNYADGMATAETSDESFRSFGIERVNSANDLSIFIRDVPRQISINCEYYTAIFDRDRIERMGQHFCTLLSSLVGSSAEAKLAELHLLPPTEKDWLDRIGNGSTSVLPRNSSLFASFSSVAQKRGDFTAVSDHTESLSYTELHQRAGGVVQALIAAGVRPGDRVAMHMERSCSAIASLLGINALGAAYLPLDPAYPPQRVSWILDDADCSVIIADAPGRKALIEAACEARTSAKKRVLLASEDFVRSTVLPPPQRFRPDSIAYVMYTSGSTGRPKGVQVFERGIMRLVINEDYVALRPDDRMLQAAPLAFDSSTFEIWGSLLNGGQLIIASRDEVLDPAALGALMMSKEITVAWFTTGLFNRQVESLPESFSHARAVLVGGDTLSPTHIRLAMEACPNTQFLNGYGPTENTTFTTVHRIVPADVLKCSIPIGRPISHTSVRVEDKAGQLAPIGIWGEIITGGDGVAEGYWNRPDLTAALFFRDETGNRFYRTGDLGRWRLDGILEFGGRKDGQIKLRGFRIELGEIEEALRLHPAIQGAAAFMRHDKGELIACLLTGGQSPKVSELRAWMHQRVPAFMVPTHFIEVAGLPINANGKLDRSRLETEAEGGRLLPDVDQAAGGAPASRTEVLVAEVFSEVFSVPVADRNASFLDLGGHSLIIIQAINRISQRSGVRLKVSDFFADPSVAGLAARIDASTPKSDASVCIPRAATDAFPYASHGEERLYVMHGMDATASAYNMTFAFHTGRGFSPEALRRALSTLMVRHEALRTGFEERKGQIVRLVIDAALARLDCVEHDLSRLPDSRSEAAGLIRQEVSVPFDLAKPPLLRLRLLRISPEETVVIIITHHIVHDGWSSRIFMRELELSYRAAVQGHDSELPTLPINLRDYAIWQRTRDGSESAAWWRKALENAPGQVALPNDRPIPERPSNRGATLRMELPSEIASGLQALAHKRGVSMAALGLSLFAALLYRLTRQRDMVLGMGVAGRDHSELEGLIGFFVNVLPVRLQLSEESEFDALIGQAHSALMASMEHRDYPFDCLVRDLAPKRSGGRQPLVNVVFEYQRFGETHTQTLFPPAPNTEESFLRSLNEVIFTQTAKHDLLFFYIEQEGRTELVFEYDTDLFDATTMERWLNYLIKFAASVSGEAK